MEYQNSSTSHDGQYADGPDEDEEEEFEDANGGNRLLGFMFGNVDNSGDLDIDYLDEDAKEHLAALADKLGSSLTDMDLSVKASGVSVDAAEHDYDQKAEDAVDYEDFDEQYEGPEIQAVTEEEFLLPKKDYLSAKVSVPLASVFDDENYDDDEEFEKDHEVKSGIEVQATTSSVVAHLEGIQEDGQTLVTVQTESLTSDAVDFQKEEPDVPDDPFDARSSTPLPVLCIENGSAILRFSKIFAIHEPLKKAEKRDHPYSVFREKYKDMDISEFVEDDEEEILKGSSMGISFVQRPHVIEDDVLSLQVDELQSAKYQDDGTILLEVSENMEDCCLGAAPMIESTSLDFSLKWSQPFCCDNCALDLQDWEQRIMWNNSPSLSESEEESCEDSGPKSVSFVCEESDFFNGPKKFRPSVRMDFVEKKQSPFLLSCSATVEPFGSRNSPVASNISEEGVYHPQLLRLESRSENEHTDILSDHTDAGEDDTVKRFSKYSLLNKDVVEGSWLEKIIWEPNQSIEKPKLILDLQDEQMLFEISDYKDGENLELHAGAMIIARPAKTNNGYAFEAHGQGGLSGEGFYIANDKFYSSKKSSQQLKSVSKKRTTLGLKVLHSVPALKLQTMKTKLSNKDIANFHRPRALWYPHDNEVVLKEQGKLPTQGPMKIILKSLGGKGSKIHVDAEETIASVKAKATKKLDFKPSEPVKIIYSGKELDDDKSLAEQSVRPNSLLHLVRTKMHLLPRAQKLPSENKSLRPPGAFKKKSDLSAKDGHIFLMDFYGYET